MCTCDDALDTDVAGTGGRSGAESMLADPGPAGKRVPGLVRYSVEVRELGEIHDDSCPPGRSTGTTDRMPIPRRSPLPRLAYHLRPTTIVSYLLIDWVALTDGGQGVLIRFAGTGLSNFSL